ncbi:MAG: biopolymer transporter ExbD [Curvibacter sp.]
MSARIKRKLGSRKPALVSLNLTSLMDVFTILVLYLLVNQGTGTEVTPPDSVKLPESIVETTPRKTIVLAVDKVAVYLDNQPVALVADILDSPQDNIESLREAMIRIRTETANKSAEAEANSQEVTIAGDRTVPFRVLKKLMATSSHAGYTRIALAVNQKE